ncbi:CcmD family protein [Schinkia azotoformans]|uniref:CcmD family protein n=1 Tax=Schinkia azotoformans TaxID=1454 RepID=UPI002DB7A8D1|nr:CcmD family protein [Schinkia azotoformans]MEC1720253.1 CcmD family protein [Schinkia azotoformans]MED4413256.1 CcmD family protein [Schinkia azotoformans]
MQISILIQRGYKPQLNKVKASGGCHRFSEVDFRASSKKSGRQIRQGAFDYYSGGNEKMNYLFMAYTIIWALIAIYIVVLGKRQSKIVKELEFIEELKKVNEAK